jgi:tripartite-type tricarboxylate transporter receptor subunit TctC
MKTIAKGLGIGLIAGSAFLAAPWVASAQSDKPTFVDGKLQPLADGFPSGPLTVMVIEAPGDPDSLYATHLVKAAERISPVPIKIEHRPDFSNFPTWEALAWLNQQGPESNDGRVVYVSSWPGNIADTIVDDVKTATGVDMDDMNSVVATDFTPYFLIQRADAPWGDTLEDFLKHAKANPGTVRYISGGPGGGQDATMKWLMSKLDFTVDEIIGGSGTERALAVASSEGDVTVSSADLILPHFEGGKVDVLLLNGDKPAPKPWEGVPNTGSLNLTDDPGWGSTRGMATTKQVPDDHRAWMEALFLKAAEDPEYIDGRTKMVPGLIIDPIGHDDATKKMMAIYNAALPIMQAAGVYWKDKK